MSRPTLSNSERRDVFRALAHKTRRSILNRLRKGEQSVTQVQKALRVSQPTASQHLAVLRDAGLVRQRRIGNQVLYTLDTTGLEKARDWLDRFFEEG